MLKQYIEKIISGQNLTQQEAGEAMDIILNGQEIGRASCRERV